MIMNIGGLSGTTSNTIRGFGGLASGLDRDSLIESMTAGTTAKISKQQQKKTLLQWEQNAIRNITDKLTAFADKYTSTYTSSTNLFSDSFWGRNKITALGTNGKYVSVSGSANTADTIEIQRIKQLAQKAQLTSAGSVSDSKLETGEINVNEKQESQNLEGKTLEIKFSNKTYTVTLPTGKSADGTEYKYGTLDDAIVSINKALENVEVDGGKHLSDYLKVSKDGGKIKFEDVNKGGNILKLVGGSAVEHLGFNKETDGTFKEKDITSGSVLSDENVDKNKLITEKTFIERIAGKSLTFTYNGVSKTIKMPTEDELKATNGNILETVKTSMQKQLDDAFGKGRIEVKLNGNDSNGKFEFTTWIPAQNGEAKKQDISSVLTLSSSDAGMLGKDGAFKVKSGESNRVNLGETFVNSGLENANKLQDWFTQNPGKDFEFTINGKTVNISEGDTVQNVLDRINKETDVNISYQSTSDKFEITSKTEGASGSIKFDAKDEQAKGALKGIFGDNILDEEIGQDAKLEVKYSGSNKAIEIVRDSNTFEIDGMTLTLNGTFGYENGQPVTTEAIKFDAKVDEEKILNTMKDMVKEFNEIIELVSKEMTTKPDRDYAPLTDEQKKELSESEIEAWEKKAKEGLLFNDNDIKGLSNGLRFVLNSSDLAALEEMGLSVSDTPSDRGKLVLDETKFKAALSSNLDGLKEMFTKVQKTDDAGNIIQSDGIATNMKNVLDKYAKTVGSPKGILIERAGSVKSPLSITQNSLYKQIQEVDKRIADLQDALKMEEDRYIRQFTTLESLISQMNSQSGMLSQFGGGF